MIGLVIVTHGGRFAEHTGCQQGVPDPLTELPRGLGGEGESEDLVGPQSQLETISIGPEDDMVARRTDILDAVRRTDTGAGVIVLTDMFGGTPSNLAISVMDEANVEVIAGINLPILVKLAGLRAEVPLDEAVTLAREAGRKYIKVASQELSGEQ